MPADGFELVQAFTRNEFAIEHPEDAIALQQHGVWTALSSARPSTLRSCLDQCQSHDETSRYIASVISSLSLWFSPETFARLPVLLPHVARDNDCRKQKCPVVGHTKRMKGKLGEPRDMWSTPTRGGYVRDDNSLIKTLAKGPPLRSPRAALHGKKLGRNWVACHIRPMAEASDPWLNSFVPNLVWLPKPFDVFSDRNGHPVQAQLRRISLAIYQRDTLVPGSFLMPLWSALGDQQRGVDRSLFNYLDPGSKWIKRRWKKIRTMHSILSACAAGKACSSKSGHSHFDKHLDDLDPPTTRELARRLGKYLAAHCHS